MTTKDDAIAKVGETGVQTLPPRPAHIAKGGRAGMESMGQDDISIPRIALAQQQSPEVLEGTPKYIEGLKPGYLFNSVTGKVYGKEVFVQLVRKNELRAMQFKDIKQGGGVLRPNVPLNDPTLLWGENGEKPESTLFRDYIVILLQEADEKIGQPKDRDMMALSFKASGIKVAKMLNGLTVKRNADLFAGRYKVSSRLELKPQAHYVFTVENAGWVDEADFANGQEIYEAVKDIPVTVEYASETAVGAPPPDKDPIPF